jgi:hypothetical protein
MNITRKIKMMIWIEIYNSSRLSFNSLRKRSRNIIIDQL